jgi:hypothetical protein
MSSFSLVITCDNFRDTICQSYDNPFRLVGEWEVALTHLGFEEKIGPLFVFCDLVDYCKVNDVSMRFLDLVNPKNLRTSSPKYVKVVKKRFSRINISIKKTPEHDDLQSINTVVCVLNFRKT